MKKSILFLTVFLGLLMATAFAQGLPPSANKPVADGIIAKGEYARTVSGAGMNLSLSLSSDGKTLHVALEAPTTGWVAVGLGSLRMDGAFMVLAFDASGTMTISEQTGTGNRHKPNEVNKLSAGFVKETGSNTTLEFSLPVAEYLKDASLRMIMAFGQKDNLNSLHSAYAPIDLKL